MKIINKCGERYCSSQEYQMKVEECRVTTPKGWDGICHYQSNFPLKDFSFPNPKEGSMVTKEEFRQHLIDLGCSHVTFLNGEVWLRKEPTMVHIPLNKEGLLDRCYAFELEQCANDMVDLEAFTEYLAEKDKEWQEDTHCPYCGEYLPADYHRGYD